MRQKIRDNNCKIHISFEGYWLRVVIAVRYKIPLRGDQLPVGLDPVQNLRSGQLRSICRVFPNNLVSVPRGFMLLSGQTLYGSSKLLVVTQKSCYRWFGQIFLPEMGVIIGLRVDL